MVRHCFTMCNNYACTQFAHHIHVHTHTHTQYSLTVLWLPQIPGGWSMVVATCGPKLAIIAIVVMSAEPVVWLIVLIVNVIGAAVFSFRVLYDRRFYGRWWPRGRFNLGVPSHMSTPAALPTGCADIDGDTGTASGIGRDTGQHVRKRDRPS